MCKFNKPANYCGYAIALKKKPKKLNFPFLVSVFIVFNNPKVQGKKTALEKIGEVVDIMKKNSSDSGQLLAGMKFICKILDEEGPQERSTLRSDSAQSIR